MFPGSGSSGVTANERPDVSTRTARSATAPPASTAAREVAEGVTESGSSGSESSTTKRVPTGTVAPASGATASTQGGVATTRSSRPAISCPGASGTTTREARSPALGSTAPIVSGRARRARAKPPSPSVTAASGQAATRTSRPGSAAPSRPRSRPAAQASGSVEARKRYVPSPRTPGHGTRVGSIGRVATVEAVSSHAARATARKTRRPSRSSSATRRRSCPVGGGAASRREREAGSENVAPPAPTRTAPTRVNPAGGAVGRSDAPSGVRATETGAETAPEGRTSDQPDGPSTAPPSPETTLPCRTSNGNLRTAKRSQPTERAARRASSLARTGIERPVVPSARRWRTRSERNDGAAAVEPSRRVSSSVTRHWSAKPEGTGAGEETDSETVAVCAARTSAGAATTVADSSGSTAGRGAPSSAAPGVAAGGAVGGGSATRTTQSPPSRTVASRRPAEAVALPRAIQTRPSESRRARVSIDVAEAP